MRALQLARNDRHFQRIFELSSRYDSEPVDESKSESHNENLNTED
jgi:hypothetical protein